MAASVPTVLIVDAVFQFAVITVIYSRLSIIESDLVPSELKKYQSSCFIT